MILHEEERFMTGHFAIEYMDGVQIDICRWKFIKDLDKIEFNKRVKLEIRTYFEIIAINYDITKI